MDFFFINAGARTISKNILFDYAVPYPCYVSCASIERSARYYVLLYRFTRIVCVFTLSTHWFEWFLVSGFVMFLLFSIHWNVFPFFCISTINVYVSLGLIFRIVLMLLTQLNFFDVKIVFCFYFVLLYFLIFHLSLAQQIAFVHSF